ncbi:SDR family NAD(P)-dependent oxidoreductase [Cognatiluteimonas weifangensis]|uniref:SDR family NAD(P)-dependent oxidoreductase n=1 Tax=Cognatiluteimonas weifangensis TaxID=2303539 RepID=A0A372DSK5_9GAMM|nr:SDR family NAD(P)-dependent oxidoreductase [Luteimonas weifangensis]RFP62540.1 SDR family NAD(P)-dependent oxidoreductase [Luteimonas weifangensis]
MKVLVTGGAGFIGRHTVRRLLGEDAQVLVLDDFSSSARTALDEFAGHRGFDAITGDICDEALTRRVFERWRPEATVHLAGLVSVARSIAEPEESHRMNVGGAMAVAKAAQAAGCRRFVFASSAAVYADAEQLPLREDAILRPALSPYGAHKAEAERLLRALDEASMRVVILRYFNVYGAGQPADSPYSGVITRFLDRLARGLPLQINGDGEQSRDFVHVDDVARVNAAAAAGRLGPGTYNVCAGVPVTINALVSLLREGMPELEIRHASPQPGEIRHSLGDARKLAAALGEWQPATFSSGIARLLDS